MRYIVPKDWIGDTCVILAGGPSLQETWPKVPLNTGQRIHVITINDSWRLAPNADVLYFGDGRWWAQQQASNPRTVDGLLGFHDVMYKGFWVTIAGFGEHPQIHCMWASGQRGLETNPAALRTGSNSGYAAINLAYHHGAKKIVLLGYDMKCDGRRTHWHNGPREAAPMYAPLLNSFLPHFDHLVEPLEQAGVEVIN